MATAETVDVLITVKSYPAPSRTYKETVCVAGIQLTPTPHRFIRLFPIRFRDLPAANS